MCSNIVQKVLSDSGDLFNAAAAAISIATAHTYLNDLVGIVEQFNNRVCAANILDAQATVPAEGIEKRRVIK